MCGECVAGVWQVCGECMAVVWLVRLRVPWGVVQRVAAPLGAPW